MLALLLLGFLWAAVLLPVAWKAHQERQAKFVSSLETGLQALGQAGAETATVDTDFVTPDADDRAARPAGRPQSPAAHLRSILAGLLVAVAVSLFVAVVTSQRAMLGVHLAILDSLLAFVALLVIRRDARSRPRTQRPRRRPHLPAPPVPEPVALPRPVYSAGVPVISAPLVSHAMTSTPANHTP